MAESIQLLNFTDPGSIEAKLSSAVKDIFDNYKNEKCLLIGGMGRFREGKSFLMSLLYQSSNQTNSIQNIFKVDYGDESVTKGIFITKKPLIKVINGQTINIFFLDSQGLFATDIKRTDNLIVSILLSICSIVIFNVNKRLSTEDIKVLKLNLYLGVPGNEYLEESKIKTIIFTCRNRVINKREIYGKFDNDFKDKETKKSANLSCLLEAFQQLSFSLFPEPNKNVKSENFNFNYNDIGSNFTKAKDDLVSELDNLFNRYAPVANTGSEVYKNMVKSINSIVKKDFIIQERSQTQLFELAFIQSELHTFYERFKTELIEIFNRKYNAYNLNLIKDDERVILSKYNNYIDNFILEKAHLNYISKIDVIPLKEKFIETINTLFSSKYNYFAAIVKKLEEEEKYLAYERLKKQREDEERLERLKTSHKRKLEEIEREKEILDRKRIEREERQRRLKERAERERIEKEDRRRPTTSDISHEDVKLKYKYMVEKRKMEEEIQRIEYEARMEEERFREELEKYKKLKSEAERKQSSQEGSSCIIS